MLSMTLPLVEARGDQLQRGGDFPAKRLLRLRSSDLPERLPGKPGSPTPACNRATETGMVPRPDVNWIIRIPAYSHRHVESRALACGFGS